MVVFYFSGTRRQNAIGVAESLGLVVGEDFWGWQRYILIRKRDRLDFGGIFNDTRHQNAMGVAGYNRFW